MVIYPLVKSTPRVLSPAYTHTYAPLRILIFHFVFLSYTTTICLNNAVIFHKRTCVLEGDEGKANVTTNLQMIYDIQNTSVERDFEKM